MKKFLSPYPIALDAGLALVRIVTGYFMIYHGWEVFDKTIMDNYLTWDSFKRFSSPAFMAYLGKGSELVAGLLLLPGLLTRFASVVIIGTMTYVALFVGGGKIWYEDQHPFMFVLLGFVYLFTGGGRYSLDYLLFKKYRRRVY